MLENMVVLGDPSCKIADELWEMVERAAEKNFGLYLRVFGNKNKLIAYEGLVRIGLCDIVEWMAQRSAAIPMALHLECGNDAAKETAAAARIAKMLCGSNLEYVLFCANRDTLRAIARNHAGVKTGVRFNSLFDLERTDLTADGFQELGCKHLVVKSTNDEFERILRLNNELAALGITLWVMTDECIAYAQKLLGRNIKAVSFCPNEVITGRH